MMSEISFSPERQQEILEIEVLAKAREILRRDGKKTYDLINFDAFPIAEPVPGLSFDKLEPNAEFEIIDQPSFTERKRQFLKTKTIRRPAFFALTLHLKPKERKVEEGIAYTLAFPENSTSQVAMYTEVTPQTFFTLLYHPNKAFEFKILREGSPGRADLILFRDVLDMLIEMGPS